jgi:hypothetical protein
MNRGKFEAVGQAATFHVCEADGTCRPFIVRPDGSLVLPPYPSLVLLGTNRTREPMELTVTVSGPYFGDRDRLESVVPAHKGYSLYVDVNARVTGIDEIGRVTVEAIAAGASDAETFELSIVTRTALSREGLEEPEAIRPDPHEVPLGL